MKVKITQIIVLVFVTMLFSYCSKETDKLTLTDNGNETELKTAPECIGYPLQDYMPQNTLMTSFEDLIITGNMISKSVTNPNSPLFPTYVQCDVTNSTITLPQLASSVSISCYYGGNKWESQITAYDINGIPIGSDNSGNINSRGWENLSISDINGKIAYITLRRASTIQFSRWKNLQVCYAASCEIPTAYADTDTPVIWPPNNKEVEVIFFGNNTNDCEDATYTLVDEYGEYSYSGDIPDGPYSIDLILRAKRNGKDKDGRKYTFTITSSNDEGTTSASVDAIVPHDNRP